jgi:hypothetical protein
MGRNELSEPLIMSAVTNSLGSFRKKILFCHQGCHRMKSKKQKTRLKIRKKVERETEKAEREIEKAEIYIFPRFYDF